MDPFEVRIRFTSMLQSLNASVTSANKAAQYALKYRDMDEDLHSCILEQLERNSINNRANILHFLTLLCDMAARESHPDYVRMMQRDILRIVDAVAPEDGSGAANVKVVRRVLSELQGKGFLLAQTVGEIEDCLRERDIAAAAVDETIADGESGGDVEMPDAGTDPSNASGAQIIAGDRKKSGATALKLDKKVVEQRIEEDRERHKRLREGIWATPVGGDEAEFERLWEQTSEVGEDDFMLYQEESEERRKAATEWRDEVKQGAVDPVVE